MKTLITGASGLLGNHLTRLFISRGHQVKVLIENENADEGLDDPGILKCICDIRDPLQVKGCASGMDVIVHAAADTSVWPCRSEKVRDVNIRGTEHLIEEGLHAGVKRFIFVSSASAFNGDYYESKELAQELILKAVRERGLPGIVVNPTFMVGPGDYKMNAARLISSIKNRKLPGLTQSLLASIWGSPPTLCYHMARGSCQRAYYSSEKARKCLRLSGTPISVAVRETIDWLETYKPNGHV